MMLEHVAIWTHQLEKMKDFYVKYFDAVPNAKYISKNPLRAHFESYFLTFESSARLELMEMMTIPAGDNADGFETTGLTHLAFAVGSKTEVDKLFARLKQDGHRLVLDPHMTGDGYYEACILDPDGNRLEIIMSPAP